MQQQLSFTMRSNLYSHTVILILSKFKAVNLGLQLNRHENTSIRRGISTLYSFSSQTQVFNMNFLYLVSFPPSELHFDFTKFSTKYYHFQTFKKGQRFQYFNISLALYLIALASRPCQCQEPGPRRPKKYVDQSHAKAFRGAG